MRGILTDVLGIEVSRATYVVCIVNYEKKIWSLFQKPFKKVALIRFSYISDLKQPEFDLELIACR